MLKKKYIYFTKITHIYIPGTLFIQFVLQSRKLKNINIYKGRIYIPTTFVVSAPSFPPMTVSKMYGSWVDTKTVVNHFLPGFGFKILMVTISVNVQP